MSEFLDIDEMDVELFETSFDTSVSKRSFLKKKFSKQDIISKILV